MSLTSPIIYGETKKSKDVSITKALNTHDDIVTSILNELILECGPLIYKVKSNQFKVDKDVESSRQSLEVQIKKRISDKNKNLDFDTEIVYKNLHSRLFAYWIIQPLIEDEDISDIDFTRYDHCTIKRNGVKEIVDLKFSSDKEFEAFAKLLVVSNGGIINADENHRRVADERYRLRINVAIPPRNVTGTSLIIRKHRMNPYTIDDLVGLGMMSQPVGEYLKKTYRDASRNIIHVGQGASGKTTLLRAGLMESNPVNNYLVCEKDTELYLNDLPNFIIQRIKKESDGGKLTSLKELVRDGLTMSVEGMVVGELVGDETFDFLSAGYTDHVIYGTAHTSGVHDTASRLITMIDTGSRGLSEGVINQIIAGAIDDIVYLEKFKVKEIKRITGYNRVTNEFEYFDVLKAIENGESVE